MSKAFKKLTGLLLAMLMVVTLIPVMGGKADAEEAQIALTVNGQATGAYVTRKWMDDHSMDKAQVFPFAAQKGKTWVYTVAQGPRYAEVLTHLTGAEKLADLEHVVLKWNNNELNWLYVSDLMKANDCFKLVDQNGNDITGAFNGDGIVSAKVVTINGAVAVTPIVALTEKEYSSYTDAQQAITDSSWKTDASTKVRPYLGGNLNKDVFVKEGGKIIDASVNFTGRFSMADLHTLDLGLEVDPATASLTFTNTTPKTVAFPEVVTEKEKEMFFTGETTWESSDTTVATVDKAGTVTPTGKIGSCTVTKKGVLKAGEPMELGRCTVTMDKSAFTPAKPAGVKVKNVKRRSAKLTWKKTANANGYIIYRSTKKNKGFKKVKTIKNGKTTKFVNKKLKKRKTYYYKVQAYRNYQGTMLYSPLTAAKKVKIKK